MPRRRRWLKRSKTFKEGEAVIIFKGTYKNEIGTVVSFKKGTPKIPAVVKVNVVAKKQTLSFAPGELRKVTDAAFTDILSEALAIVEKRKAATFNIGDLVFVTDGGEFHNEVGKVVAILKDTVCADGILDKIVVKLDVCVKPINFNSDEIERLKCSSSLHPDYSKVLAKRDKTQRINKMVKDGKIFTVTEGKSTGVKLDLSSGLELSVGDVVEGNPELNLDPRNPDPSKLVYMGRFPLHKKEAPTMGRSYVFKSKEEMEGKTKDEILEVLRDMAKQAGYSCDLTVTTEVKKEDGYPDDGYVLDVVPMQIAGKR